MALKSKKIAAAKARYDKAESVTDSLLMRLVGSRWTLAILVAVAMGGLVAWLL